MASESVSDALHSSLWAGFGAVLLEGVVLAFCLFEPSLKSYIFGHMGYVIASLPVISIASFCLSLSFTLALQFRRGKWD